MPALPLTHHVTLGKLAFLSLGFLISAIWIIVIDNYGTSPASEFVKTTCVNACHEHIIMPGLQKYQQMEALRIANTHFWSRLTLPAFSRLSINNRGTWANHSAGQSAL